MLQHTFLLAYRNFRRFKSTFFINLAGLSSGLVCALLIFLWVKDEMDFDRFHKNEGQLFQVMSNEQFPDGVKTMDGTSGILGEVLEKEVPEVAYATAITPPSWFQKFTLADGERSVNSTGFFAGKDYFNVFSYDLVVGDADRVLSDKNAIVISRQLALQLFKTTENVVGKTLEWKWYEIKKPCVVSGIFENVPTNSTYQFDFVLSFEVWKDIVPATTDLGSPGPFHTFLVLKEGTSVKEFNDKVAGFIKKKYPHSTTNLFVRPYADGYLYGNYENGVQAGGRITYVKLFSSIAIFILVLACVNFMNLSTAKASVRIKEVGIKRVVGAPRKALILQYMSESLLISFMSLVLALAAVQLLLPQFNLITAKHLRLNFEPEVIVFILAITCITGLVAGSYPALYMSGFNPAVVLKGKFKSSAGEFWIRKGLVVFQFALTVIFIVSVLVVYKQTEFIQAKNLGYSKDHVIYFETEGRAASNLETFLTEVKSIPGVKQASSMMGGIIRPSFRPATGIQWDGKNQDDKVTFAQLAVNYDLIETLDMQMATGRSFSRNSLSDEAAVIFNEAAIKAMEIQQPLGKIISIQGREMKIIGVVKNFHFQSYYETIKPLYFRLAPQETMTAIVKMEAGKQDETLNRLQEFYKAYNPGFVLAYKFLEHDFQAQYASEKRVAVLAKGFTCLAILISGLGLFGLAAHTTERRIKEIGIRKILGSSAFGIAWLLTFDFAKSVMLSISIALPISYVLVSDWLNTFAYRIELETWYFAGAGGVALVIAWITVSTQALRGAAVNPTQCLKNE